MATDADLSKDANIEYKTKLQESVKRARMAGGCFAIASLSAAIYVAFYLQYDLEGEPWYLIPAILGPIGFLIFWYLEYRKFVDAKATYLNTLKPQDQVQNDPLLRSFWVDKITLHSSAGLFLLALASAALIGYNLHKQRKRMDFSALSFRLYSTPAWSTGAPIAIGPVERPKDLLSLILKALSIEYKDTNYVPFLALSEPIRDYCQPFQLRLDWEALRATGVRDGRTITYFLIHRGNEPESFNAIRLKRQGGLHYLSVPETIPGDEIAIVLAVSVNDLTAVKAARTIRFPVQHYRDY
jgi:hypothetical protein